MKSTLLPVAFLAAIPFQLQANWLDEVSDIHNEIRDLTANEEGWSDERRLSRYYILSYELAILENPDFATSKGAPVGQDRLPDLSESSYERRRQAHRDALSLIESINSEGLPEPEKVNFDLLRNSLKRDVAGQRFPVHLMPMNQLGGPQLDIAHLLSIMPNDRVEYLENQIARMEALPAYVDQAIRLMKKGLRVGVTPPRITLRNVPQQIRAQLVDDPSNSPLLRGFGKVPDTVEHQQAESLRLRAADAYRKHVFPAYEKLLKFTENEYLPGAREGIAARDFPDGEAWYRHNVALETTTDLTPQQIHEIGISEVTRIRAEMESIIVSTGFDGSFAEFLLFLRNDPGFYHSSDEALLREYRDIAKRVDPKLIRLFNVLPRTPYGVVAMPDYIAESAPAAYYQPGSLKAARPGYFLPNTYALESRPRWQMEALVLHEAVPGHHLQYSLQQELEDVPWFRQEPSYTAFVEGWGLYSESLGMEMGFYKDPYAKFGRLTYEIWRAIRLVVDTGMHHLGWSRRQAIEYFMENAGKSEHDAVVEIDRYIVWPGQALAYKIGEFKFKELRAYAEESLGNEFDIRDFHDEVLGNGAVPLDVLDANIRAWVETRRPQTF